MGSGDASLPAGAGYHLFSGGPRREAPLTTHNDRFRIPINGVVLPVPGSPTGIPSEEELR